MHLWLETRNSIVGQTNNPYDNRRTVGGSTGNYWVLSDGLLFRMSHFRRTVLLKPSWVEQNCQRKPRSGMAQGWSQVSQTSFSQILSAPSPNKIFNSLCFFSVCPLQGFFDTYFAVKSHLRVLKFFEEFINFFKTGFKSKIRIPWAEILAFSWDKVHRNSISLTIEDFITGLGRVGQNFSFFWFF